MMNLGAFFFVPISTHPQCRLELCYYNCDQYPLGREAAGCTEPGDNFRTFRLNAQQETLYVHQKVELSLGM